MPYFLALICLASLILSAADVSHLKNNYLPPHQYLPPAYEDTAASNQHEVIAPVMIVGEQARFVSYALPDAPIGEASNQISAVIPAPAHDYENAVENYSYESAPTNFIKYTAPAPQHFTNNYQNFVAAPSQLMNYFVPAPVEAELFNHHNDFQNFEAAPSNEVKYTAPAPVQHNAFQESAVAAPSISVYSYTSPNDKFDTPVGSASVKTSKFASAPRLPAASTPKAHKVKAPYVTVNSYVNNNNKNNKNRINSAPAVAASNIDTKYAANGGYDYEPKFQTFFY